MKYKEEQLDFLIIRDGAISMYHDQSILSKDLNELEKIGYKIVDFNTAKWNSKSCHEEIKAGLNFPDYYGENLDAFNDCLGDLISVNRIGMVIVFRRFDEFVSLDNDYCEALLDVISCQSRMWILKQKRLICLIQSLDPDLCFGKVGGINPNWNGGEWSDDDRRKE